MSSIRLPTIPAPYWAVQLWRHLAIAFVIGTVMGTVMSLLSRQGLVVNLVFAWCIALGCSLSIDVLRRAATAWVHRRDPGAEAAQARWPGWGWMMACLVLGTPIGYTLGSELASALTGRPGTNLLHGNLAAAATLFAVSLIPGIAATYFYLSRGRLQAALARAESAQRQAAETRLKLLESQLEPHMLFNTLANLRVLIALDPDRAQDMLDRLIAFLRATLGASRTPLHPLSAEFDRLADYLALMQVRMGERLRVELALPTGLAGVPVPPLLLQPLVENAIKHGLEPQRGGGLIRVEAVREGGDIVLRVTDTGVGPVATARPPDTAGSGFGLTQVRERLATQYGPAAHLDLAPGPDGAGGTIVTLRWPASQPTR